MINTDTLLKEARAIYSYGRECEVDIGPPVGIDNPPDEWMQKIGTHHLEQPYLVELENVHLCGNAMVGVLDGDVVLDTAYYGRLDLFERNSPYFESAVAAYEVDPVELDIAMSFVGVWSHNYFHWTLDHLPKLEAIDKYKEQTGENPALLLAPRPPGFIIDAIPELPYNWQHIAHPHYLVRRLLVATTRRSAGVMHPDALDYLRNRYQEHKIYTSPRLYVSRRYARNRHVTNEIDELDDYLLNRGFQIITTERMGIQGQVDRFRHADYVIAPHGAGLSNIAWSDKPNVIELVQPEYTNPCCWLIGEMKGSKYGYVVCDSEEDENMSVPMHKLDAVMEMIG